MYCLNARTFNLMRNFLFCYFRRQLHSLCEEKAQLAVAYETIKSLPPTHSPPAPVVPSLPSSTPSTPLLNPYAVSAVSSPTISENGSPALSVTRTPNICIEDGRIEFVRDAVDGVRGTNVVGTNTCTSSHINNNVSNNGCNNSTINNNNNHYREYGRRSREEKIDSIKVSEKEKVPLHWSNEGSGGEGLFFFDHYKSE